MRRLAGLLAAGLVALFAFSGSPAVAQPLPAAKTCNGVWVVVDYGDLGGVSTKCASSFGTGTKALTSAGFSIKNDGGMILKINGKPKTPDIQKSYWSYWHAERQADGSYGAWKYSNKGAGSYQPTKGSAEGWRYQDLSDGKVAPGAKPPAAEPKPTAKPKPTKAPKPEPSKTAKPTKNPSKPKPTATSKPKPTPTTKPTVTKPKPTSKPSSPTPEPTPSTPASNAPPSTEVSATPTPVQSAAPSESALPTPPTETPSAEPPSQPDSGSPVAAIAAGLVVAAGGGSAGLWWWLKGRHR